MVQRIEGKPGHTYDGGRIVVAGPCACGNKKIIEKVRDDFIDAALLEDSTHTQAAIAELEKAQKLCHENYLDFYYEHEGQETDINLIVDDILKKLRKYSLQLVNCFQTNETPLALQNYLRD